jgi:hypothetical protein
VKHDDPNAVDCGPTCAACAANLAAEVEQTERRAPGRPRLDVLRVCSSCSAPVERGGTLTPAPLCVRCYHRARRAKGRAPTTAARPRVLRVRVDRAASTVLDVEDDKRRALELAHLLTTGKASVDR